MEILGYCIRVDAIEGYLEKIKALEYVTDYQSIISVKHMGKEKTNPHYHLVIKTNVKQQTLRVRMKKVFSEGKGNGHLSVKVWDGDDKAVSYLFHEDLQAPLVVRKCISDEYLEKAKQQCERIQCKVTLAKDKASYKLEEIVLEHFKKEGEDRPDRCLIAQQILLTAWRSDKYAPNDWLLKSMVHRIQFKLCNGNDKMEEDLAYWLASKVFRD